MPRRAIARPPVRQRSYAPPWPPAWLREVVAAAKAELGAAPAAVAGVDLGPARPDHGPALAARYRVDLRGARVGLEALSDLALAQAGDPERRLPVIEVVAHSGDVLTVLAPASHDDLRLFATVDPAAPLRALVAALEEVEDPGLADRFDTRVLDRPPATTPRRAELSAEEAAAWAASCAPGFNVVWAPAGTDATRVVAEVATELAGAGRRVLVVSVAGAAVDRAAMETLRLLGAAEPGRIVRVGPPCLAGVADHPFLRLERASERHAEAELARLAEIERRAAALRAEPDQLLLERAERLLAGFDRAGYERARRLIDQANALEALERRAEEQERELLAAREERERAGREFDQAAAAVAEVAEARAAYQEIDQLNRQLAAEQGMLDHDREHIRKLMRQLEEARDAVADHDRLPPVRRATRMGTGSRIRAVQRDAEGALLPAWELVVERERRTAELRRRIEAEEKRAAAVVTRDQIDRRDQARGQARERLEAATTVARDQRQALRALRQDLDLARRAAGPTEADRRLVSAAEDQELPDLASRLEELRAAARPGTEELAELAAERERLTATTAALGPDLIARAAVVATTLDRMAADPAVRQHGYDHVIVAEAAAALPPSVVLAATLAGRGVTLVGDPLQSGPASAQEESRVLAVSRWLLRDSLSTLGLDHPDQLAERQGCTTLAPARRLGPDTTELANRVAYEGHLYPVDDADLPGLPDDGLGELVLVDVARYGDLARARVGVRSSRREWWPVGALLAAAIARHHDAPDSSTALMAPHAAQVRLAEAALVDAGVGERAQAGPPSRFLGQSFPVAVLDMVEDGREPGWLARGRIDGTRHELRGLRLFDTGTTRAARTYLLADAGAVERAEAGPLRHLGDLRREGRVSVVGGGRFLPVDWRRREPGGRAPALLALERDAFHERLEAELAAATGEVWVWSPQLAARPTPVLDWLGAAAGRGCRVTVFVKPPHEHRPNDERRLAALGDAGLNVVAVYDLAERLVVVDRRRCFLGNVSVLASPRDRDEGMVMVEGDQVAGALLALEQAEAFSAAPACPRHQAERCYAQRYRRGRDQGWFWTCPRCGQRQPVEFTD